MILPPQTKVMLPDEPTQQAWEEMRVEVLHELQDGGEVTVARLDDIGEMLARFPYTIVEKLLPMTKPLAV